MEQQRIKASWLTTPPSLSELAREVLSGFDLDIPTQSDETALVERLVGSLRVSGFTEQLTSEKDISLASDIVRNKIVAYRKHLAKAYAKDYIDKNLKTAAAGATTAVAADNTSEKFLEIEALMKKGKCPRCKTSMTPVKLRRYEAANFCSSCRTTVWTN